MTDVIRESWLTIKNNIKKKLKKGYVLLIVPNTKAPIRNLPIPYFVFLSFFVLFSINLYFLIRYPFRISEIIKLEYKVYCLREVISKQDKVLRRIDPCLSVTQELEKKLNEQNRFFAEMEQQYNVVRNRKNISIKKIGLVHLPQYTLSSTDQDFSKLGVLNNNLDYLEKEVEATFSSLNSLFTKYKAYDRQLDFTPTIWPLVHQRRISSGYGYRRHPVYKRSIKHQGLDIPARYGTPVRATAEGKITIAGSKGGYGLLVEIDHGYGYKTRYGHNSRLVVKKGRWVKKGQIIAYAGSTGTSTGPHVHYEVRINNVPVNPRPYMK
jgi:murein DD-endopeptidase MepM/ murein hydrolase activator NlpD